MDSNKNDDNYNDNDDGVTSSNPILNDDSNTNTNNKVEGDCLKLICCCLS
jgi:hypothetical protein